MLLAHYADILHLSEETMHRDLLPHPLGEEKLRRPGMRSQPLHLPRGKNVVDLGRDRRNGNGGAEGRLARLAADGDRLHVGGANADDDSLGTADDEHLDLLGNVGRLAFERLVERPDERALDDCEREVSSSARAAKATSTYSTFPRR